MEQVQRIGISVERELLLSFDKLITAQGYLNRSEAIRDLIRNRLSAQQLTNPQSSATAAVFVVYDHHHARLAQKIIEIQHSHLVKTISSIHIHLDHHSCLEVILLRGKVGEITKLSDHLVSLKGVKLGKINLIAAG